MIYITCPTCGYFIGSKVMEYKKGKDTICNNPELTQEQQELEIQKLIKSLNFRRYCCQMRLMTCKELVNDIVPVEND